MKKALSILLLSTLPALALAAGGHTGGHDMKSMPGHDMSSMKKADVAIGQPGNAAKVTRTIELVLDDTMRFTPGQINVKPGETVRFLVKNAGKIPHEMMIGTTAELKEHAEMMRKMPGMKHAESNMITLNPGQKGGMVWQFPQTGTVDFACLVPGHMEAGMVGQVKIIG
ncbi:cupredoxin domain-containing protein [Paralcaligenes ureilyticus]|uniref:Putative cupredoxin-like copper-binding protein n=1 Tax=Paralcaligenes ureilyticus TaxID=627131 RepID=A0A4R3M340_9BURK|nr:cupredoxin family protein [Paralcaligenes ureilyticus]TCT07063.1 putative cupredoxin-like copper-binding protein [Paralcaligenes ureilyticus]